MPSTKFIRPLVPINIAANRSGQSFESASKRILIIRLGAYGDILMGTPLLRALRIAYPNAWITWVVEHSHVEVMDTNPYVDEVLVWNGSEMLGRGGPLRLLKKPFKIAWLKRELAKRNFDIFISFQAEEHLELTRLVAAKIGIGFFDYFNIKPITDITKKTAQTLFNHIITKPDHPFHRTQQFLSVLSFLSIPTPADLHMNLAYTEEDDTAITKFLSKQGIQQGEQYAVISPMSTWVTRNWELSRYAEINDYLQTELGLRTVVIGSKRQSAQVQRLVELSSTPTVAAAGTFSFRTMCALIDRAKLLVSGDSGPMHVAGAMSTPYVAIFGSTPVARFAPLAGHGISLSRPVDCGPCDSLTCSNASHPLLCLDLVQVDDVKEACRKALDLK